MPISLTLDIPSPNLNALRSYFQHSTRPYPARIASSHHISTSPAQKKHTSVDGFRYYRVRAPNGRLLP